MKGKISKGFTLAVLGSMLAGMAMMAPASRADDNFLCDYPFEDGRLYQAFRWDPKEFPIKVYIPPVNLQVPNPNMYIPLVQQAFGAWTQATRLFRFQFVDNPKDAQIVVMWRNYFGEEEGQWGEATFPKPYLSETGEIRHKSELHLAVRAQPGSAVGSVGAVPFSYDELLAIATHEAGHALGVTHSDSEEDIMSVYISRNTASRKWAITQRDVNTLFALYRLPKQLKVHPCAGK